MYRRLLFLAIAYALSVPMSALPADKFNSCQAPPDIQVQINTAGNRSIDDLYLKNPGNLWIGLAYIDSKGGNLRSTGGIPTNAVPDTVVERFRSESENRPEDPESAYLYAYSLIHKNTAKAVDILTALTRKDPPFARAWLSLATIHTNSAFLDSQKVNQYTEKFLAACPNTLDSRIASLAQQLGRSDTISNYMKSLREQVAGKEDSQTLTLYPALWQLESKLALPAERAEYRKLLEKDLKFLEGLDKFKNGSAEFLLTQGYQILGKGGTAGDINSSTAFIRAQSEWQMANPRPSADASPEILAAYSKKQLQFANEWMDKLPDNPTVIPFWATAVLSQPDASDAVLIREGNKALAALNRSGIVSTTSFDVLRIWAQRGLELERVQSMVQDVMRRQLPVVSSAARQSDLYSDNNLMIEDMRWRNETKGWGILVTAYVKSGQLSRARDVLADWEKGLETRRSKAKEINNRLATQSRTPTTATAANTSANSLQRAIENSIVTGIRTDEARYYNASAKLAAAENRTLDALAFYQLPLHLMYERTSLTDADVGTLEDLQEADKLWKKLGGSEAGWKALLQSMKPAPSPIRLATGPQWTGLNRTIPQFSVSDQNGEKWSLDSFKGKTTLINIWATWCGPCRAELPLVQELYKQSKDRSDIQVITLNVDSDQSLVEPFLKENKYSFPSLFAKSFMDGFAGPIGIPLTWIVDSSGKIRNETLGYSSSNTDWVGQTLKRMESIKTAENKQ